MQIVPGELSIVTGIPNSGKSEFIDALMCNLAEIHGWSFALCSMEKKVGTGCFQLDRPASREDAACYARCLPCLIESFVDRLFTDVCSF